MPVKWRVACVQMDSAGDPSRNHAFAVNALEQAAKRGARLVAYPENCFWRGRAEELSIVAVRTRALVREFQEAARKRKVWVLLGSVIEKTSGKKFYNTSLLISPRGKIQARYRKIHLFDSNLHGARTRESKHILSGKKPVLAKIDGVSAGMTICYDLRFPELFRHLSAKGCRIFFVPSNFTETTGKVHWEILLKARAVENLAFVIAPGQVGTHPESKIRSFGTSLIVGPWGNILARGSRTKQQILFADLDFRDQARLRSNFPVLEHRRLKAL